MRSWRPHRRTDQELACVELVKLVTDYLEHALPPAVQRQVEAHLAGCEHCAEYLNQMVQTVALLTEPHGAEPAPTMSDASCAELVATFNTWTDR